MLLEAHFPFLFLRSFRLRLSVLCVRNFLERLSIYYHSKTLPLNCFQKKLSLNRLVAQSLCN